jgi:hypothetical protein
VITEIRSRERNGLIELPKPRGMQRDDGVRIVGGRFSSSPDEAKRNAGTQGNAGPGFRTLNPGYACYSNRSSRALSCSFSHFRVRAMSSTS